MNITTGKGDIRVAIIGVGNCANSLVQGVTYYKDAALDQELQSSGQIYFLISVKTGEGVESLMKFIHERIENEGHV